MPLYSKKYNCRYKVSFSTQKPETDTVAVDENNKPVHAPDGGLVFRPGGHGALIANLNQVDADIIFIKNIDTVMQDSKNADTLLYK